MALNVKKADRKKTKADEMLEQAAAKDKSRHPDNSAISTVDALDEAAKKVLAEDTVAGKEDFDNPPVLDAKGNPDRGYGLNKDGSFKQSKAGRKKKNSAEKKVQIVLTIPPEILSHLEKWASDKPRSAANYVSMFVEENIVAITNYFDKK